MKTAVTTAVVLAVACGGGMTLSLATASAQDGSSERPVLSSTPVPGVYQKELPPATTLGNGATAGWWRPETPIAQRPDYLPVQFHGKQGYVKRTDLVSELYIPLERQTGTHTLTAAQEAEVRAEAERVRRRADDEGRVFATVYGQDGATAIGRVQIDDVGAG